MSLPNVLSSIRLSIAPVLLVLAILDQPDLFISFLVLAFLLDAIDGPLARRLHQVTELGPFIDSCADFAIYITFAIGAWLLWPAIILREIMFIGLLLASILMPVLSGLVKFRQIISYHTWSVKIAAVCMAPSALLLFLVDVAWPFRLATIFCCLAGLEEVFITMVLQKPYSNVKTIFHVLKKQ